jgi:hypothetical protein
MTDLETYPAIYRESEILTIILHACTQRKRKENRQVNPESGFHRRFCMPAGALMPSLPRLGKNIENICNTAC